METTNIISILLIAIVVEAITEILVASELTDPLRKKWKEWTYPSDKPPNESLLQYFMVWADKLISCGYCTSVWVAGFCGIWCPKLHVGNAFIDWIFISFALHRISTWIHVVYELVKKGRVKTYDLLIKTQEE